MGSNYQKLFFSVIGFTGKSGPLCVQRILMSSVKQGRGGHNPGQQPKASNQNTAKATWRHFERYFNKLAICVLSLQFVFLLNHKDTQLKYEALMPWYLCTGLSYQKFLTHKRTIL